MLETIHETLSVYTPTAEVVPQVSPKIWPPINKKVGDRVAVKLTGKQVAKYRFPSQSACQDNGFTLLNIANDTWLLLKNEWIDTIPYMETQHESSLGQGKEN